MTNELGFLFPRFVTFIVNGRVTFLDPTARHIQWMVLRLAAPPLPMPCCYTALARSGTTNWIPIAWIHIVFLLDLRYDGGLFCSLVHDGSAPMEELYPPGMRVERLDPTSQ